MSEDPEMTDKRLVRGEPIVKKVLAATMEEVALTGYEGLTLERVAARAGVNRTTIYRRWPTKKDLLEATIEHASASVKFDWDLGSLRADLAELLRRAGEQIFTPGMLGMHRMMMDACKDAGLREAARCARDEKHSHAIAMLTRAEKRGELRGDIDKELFLDGMFGALFARVVFQNEPLTPAFIKRLLDHLVAMASPVKSTPHARRAARAGKAPRKHRAPARTVAKKRRV
jgi:AcrR family transcriptional regulator